MPKSKVENDIVEKQKIISSLTLMDDLFMKVVLQDKECTEYISANYHGRFYIKAEKTKPSKEFLKSPWTFFDFRLPLLKMGLIIFTILKFKITFLELEPKASTLSCRFNGHALSKKKEIIFRN